jgi:hypothetical protein
LRLALQQDPKLTAASEMLARLEGTAPQPEATPTPQPQTMRPPTMLPVVFTEARPMPDTQER